MFPTHLTVEDIEVEPMGYKEDLQAVNANIDKLAGTVESKSARSRVPLYLAIASLLITILGLPLALLAWIEPHLESDQKATIRNEVAAQLSEPLKKLNEIDNHVVAVDTTLNELKPFIHDVIEHQFESASKLRPQALAGSLPAIKHLVKLARSQDVRVDSGVSEALSKNLLHVEEGAPGYWPAAAELVSYRSAATVLPRNDKQCNGEKITVNDTHTSDMGLSGTIEASNCTLNLDVEDIWQLNAKQGSTWDLVLHNVRVHYSGAPLLGLRSIIFDHCILDFQLNQPPASPSGRALTLQLLASTNAVSVEVHLG